MIIQIQYISLKKGMVNALKKNQIIIFAIALMLITAGYLNYSMRTEQTAETSAFEESEKMAGIGDAKLVSNNNVVDNEKNNNISKNDGENINSSGGNQISETNKTSSTNNSNIDSNEKKSENSIETSGKTGTDLDTYFSESRIEREKMYSEMLESYQSILANSSVSAEQKNTAQTEISNINKQKNAIMISENLIKNKGFKDIIIFVNNGSVSAVVRAEKIEEAEIAQVQSIIQRELGVSVENIHISNK